MLRGCPDFWDTPCCIFAADNFMVELKTNRDDGIQICRFMQSAKNSCPDLLEGMEIYYTFADTYRLNEGRKLLTN